ncbi:unannotated protein [freshwater metagenome]|uniref:Unannotated protein n=1 Tax=freshwater metagenome TaxID=449393 RepID=A0A6J7FTI2_9ZZZZ|nr:hypothetical protein [Actinomycetota bacterium]
MGKWLVERRLKQSGVRLRRLRDELGVIDEQLEQLSDEADDMGIRSLVAETPGSSHDYHHAQAHADAMARHRVHVVESIAELERRQDQLLDRLVG